MQLKSVLRDTVIVLGMSLLAGIAAAAALKLGGEAAASRRLLAIAVSNLVFTTAGFCISGALVRVDRFRHLLAVAVLVWLAGAVNLVLAPISVQQWVLSAGFVLAAMAVGGGLSFLFAPATRPGGN
ncbi:MAG: hypothetical protein ISP90_13855 [Nevskia sp.]|nr:hypothetical protein [Nevskia sp.]